MKRKAKSARTKSGRLRKSAPTAEAPVHGPLDAYVSAAADALGLTLEPAWCAATKSNLQLILRHAALVEAFPLPDDTEPAPIFHA